MRQLVYCIAVTLDGFIARPDGSSDDFPWDEEFGAHLLRSAPETFPAPFRQGTPTRSDNQRFDSVVMGRKTYEVGLKEGLTSPYPTLDQYVFSRTMKESPDSRVEVISDDPAAFLRKLKAQTGRDIWICGGSKLATELWEAGLVDRLILKLNPVVFGAGIPLFRSPLPQRPLQLTDHRTFPSGHTWLEYEVRN